MIMCYHIWLIFENWRANRLYVFQMQPVASWFMFTLQTSTNPTITRNLLIFSNKKHLSSITSACLACWIQWDTRYPNWDSDLVDVGLVTYHQTSHQIVAALILILFRKQRDPPMFRWSHQPVGKPTMGRLNSPCFWLVNTAFLLVQRPFFRWLVVSNIVYCPFHIWNVIIPTVTHSIIFQRV